MGNYFLYGLLTAGFLIGAFLSVLVGDVLHIRSWDPVWVQAVGTICAVAVAIYVPWRIDNDKKLAAERKNAELRRLSLKALGHEVWLLKKFFVDSIYAIDKKSTDALSDLVEGSMPIDPKSPLVMEPEKFFVLSHLHDETTTLYFNAVSRRLLAIIYMRAYLYDLQNSLETDETSNGINAKEYCTGGLDCCYSILTEINDEFDGFSFDLKIGAQSTE